jgi:hypothetical protein
MGHYGREGGGDAGSAGGGGRGGGRVRVQDCYGPASSSDYRRVQGGGGGWAKHQRTGRSQRPEDASLKKLVAGRPEEGGGETER